MFGRDLVHNLQFTRLLQPTQKTATFSATHVNLGMTANGPVHQIMFWIEFTAVAAADDTNYIDISFQEGALANDSDMAAIPAGESDRILREATDAPVTASPLIAYRKNTTATGTIKLGLAIGVKQYVRLVFTEVGTTDATYGIVAVGTRGVIPV